MSKRFLSSFTFFHVKKSTLSAPPAAENPYRKIKKSQKRSREVQEHFDPRVGVSKKKQN